MSLEKELEGRINKKQITNKRLRSNLIKLFLLNIIFISTLFSTNSSSIEGNIIKIIDGDTVHFQISKSKKILKIRLAGIDAPELKQNFGEESRSCLLKLIKNDSVSIVSYGEDRYKRTLAKLLKNGVDINLVMIKNGCAWFYRKYKKTLTLNDQLLYDEAEKNAKLLGIGLFKNREAIEPWYWRKKTY